MEYIGGPVILPLLTFVEYIEDYFTNIGLDSPFIFAVIFLIGIGALFTLLQAPKILTLFMVMMVMMMFVSFEWLPSWIAFVAGIGLVASFFVLNKNQGVIVDD